MSVYTAHLPAENTSQRFDKMLAQAVSDQNISRAQVQRALKKGMVVDQTGAVIVEWPEVMPQEGLYLTLTIEAAHQSTVKGETMNLDIVYEDDFLMVINKPAGLVVHPGAGNWSGTLVNGLVSYLGDDVLEVGEETRPGLVHRLDKDTTGLMVVAKSEESRLYLSRQLADRTVSRTYEAFTWGVPALPKMTFDAPIGRALKDRLKMSVTAKGRDAVTHVERRAIVGAGNLCLLECHLETGRTHQIRVHLSHAGFPLVGDQQYGLQTTAARARSKRSNFSEAQTEALLTFPRQALHARKLSFIHPDTEEEMSFEAPRPDDFAALLKLFL